MEATIKSKAIDDLLTSITGSDRIAAIAGDVCNWCKGGANQFRDEKSRKEYTISGMCQQCQDDTFGED